MFTGIVEDLGEVLGLKTSSFGGILEVKTCLQDIKVGDSVAVNGACLTAVSVEESFVAFELSPETMGRTNLRRLRRGDFVNLERALRADSRLGGHFVLGHVDFVGSILSFRDLGRHRELAIEIPSDKRKLFVEKGSVAVDGISLTVNYIRENRIFINVIPHTYENTNLKFRKVGDEVNIETDIIGKYVLNYLTRSQENLLRKFEQLF